MINSEDIESIARRFCKIMGCSPDAEAPNIEAKNWQIAAERIKETFAINQAVREHLESKPDVPSLPKSPAVYVPHN